MMYAGPTEVQWHARARMAAGADVAGQGGHELASIGLSKGIEGVALVHGEECVPLLEELVKVVRHFHLCLGHLIAEGETSSNGVVDVEHVVLSSPGVRVLLNPAQLVVLVHGGDNRSMELEGA